jgi:hypothetical protein
MSIYKLVYLSHATPSFNEKVDLPEILEKSRKNNTGVNVSGLLL